MQNCDLRMLACRYAVFYGEVTTGAKSYKAVILRMGVLNRYTLFYLYKTEYARRREENIRNEST